MKNWETLLISPAETLRHAARIIDSRGGQIAVVVDSDRHLLGTVTDADLRKALLNGYDFEHPCLEFMSTKPTALPFNSSREECVRLMQNRHILQLPLLDEAGRVVEVLLLTELYATERKVNSVVIMAGGLGTRLAQLTHTTPKPMLKIGKRPILETQVLLLRAQGFYNFFISVNHKAEVITDYFGNGSNWDVNISYINETKRLGTAGALSLLPSGVDSDIFFLINGDILSKVDVDRMLTFHRNAGSKATMAIKDYDVSVPYGVINLTERQEIASMVEKPKQRYFINAGMYILSPTALGLIPKNEFFDAPTLFEVCKSNGHKVCGYPLREYWIDIGHMSNFEQANYEFDEYFQDT